MVRRKRMKQGARPFRYKVFGEGFSIVIIPGMDGITDLFLEASFEFLEK